MNGTHYLAPLFEPASVAIIGATERTDAIGAVQRSEQLPGLLGGETFGCGGGSRRAPARGHGTLLVHRLHVAVVLLHQ